MERPESGPSYRGAAFTHWLNLVLLAAGAAAAATIDPMIWAAIVPAELAVLWALPDLPPFRAVVDKQYKKKALLLERAFYLEQLWGLSPRKEVSWFERIASIFVQSEKDDLDQRVIGRGAEFESYFEIRQIVSKLEEMRGLPGSRITEHDINRFENVVNAYLGLLLACRTLYRACAAIDERRLAHELAEVTTQLESADSSLRSVLLERRHLVESQLSRRPKLVATLELLRARIDATGHQLRNIESQAVAFPGIQLHEMLDDIIERNEMLADPLADLAADHEIRVLLDTPSLPKPPAVRSLGAAARAASARNAIKR